jgi:hypothetical protein
VPESNLPTRSLDAISQEVRQTWAAAKAKQVEAFQGYVAVGKLLTEARAALPSDQAYGAWFKEQDFGFSTEWGRRLRLVAEHEDELLATAVATGEAIPGVNRMLEMLRPEAEPLVPEPPASELEVKLQLFLKRSGELGELLRAAEARFSADTGYTPTGVDFKRVIHIPDTLEEVAEQIHELARMDQALGAARYRMDRAAGALLLDPELPDEWRKSLSGGMSDTAKRTGYYQRIGQITERELDAWLAETEIIGDEWPSSSLMVYAAQVLALRGEAAS